jgi:hypothetical protein
MKKHYSAYALLAFALILALPTVTRAEDINASVDTEDSVNSNIPPTIRQRMISDYQAKLENVKNNQGYRNAMLERHVGTSSEGDENENSTSTREMRRLPTQTEMGRFASSTTSAHGIGLRIMEERKRFATHQFQVAVDNLSNIRERLSSRIHKEQATGRDMTDALRLLAIADAKIKIASDTMASLNTSAPTASSTVTASTTANLDSARKLSQEAQKEIRDAQKALNDVVVAIAHAMGLDLGLDKHVTVEATSTENSSTTSQ